MIGLDLRRSVWPDCGIPACGFARAYCDICGHDFLVAFSCKGRGLYPSCTTRRMAEAAADLVEHVFPQVPVRQWVVTFPRRLRFFLHRDPVLLGRVRRSVLRTIGSGLRRRCPLRGLEVGAAAGGLTLDAASFGMTATGKSIFLSYASQDVDAARRICEALRAVGLEVWFDESELRGGDAFSTRPRSANMSQMTSLPEAGCRSLPN